MDLITTGKLIAELRKSAGFTQKQLADSLFITDKAVSKWERGLCLPDASLLPKLSILLDTDIEYIISDKNYSSNNKWVGEIRINDIEGTIANKPLVHYLLSYFMLIGIKDIAILTDKKDYVKSLHLENFGLNVKFSSFKGNTVIIYDKFFLFGANLTRYFQSYIASDKNTIPVVDGVELPVIFTHNPSFSVKWHKEKCDRRAMGRGMVYLPLSLDAEKFVNIYEKNSFLKIADLKEIAIRREFINEKE